MPHKLYKILLILGIVAIFIAIPVFWLTFSAENNLEVDFLDVGQGDSILIKAPTGQNILIDGGPDNTVIKRLQKELPWWDKNIDLMVLTHPHSDHASGLVDVLKKYRVKKILYTGVVHTSPNYLAWLEIVKEKKIPLIIIENPQMISFGNNCKLEILYPFTSFAGKTVDNLNNSSIVMKLIYRKNKFLFMGDIEEDVEAELKRNKVDLRADVLKVGHHGSRTSSSREFLELVRPKIAVISVGADNDFGHPSKRAIKRLERIGAEIFRTDLDGTVKFISNGEKIWR